MFSSIYNGAWDRDATDYLALYDHWHVVALSEDVAEGKPLHSKLLGEDLVLWRADGAVHAWKDYCAHRGARLSGGWVRDGNVVCPYHGWRFNTAGHCTHVPAHPDQTPPRRAIVQPYRCEERYGFIWACLGTPSGPPPRLPEWEDDSFRKVHAGPYVYKANALRAIENFLDPSHFPYVHAYLNGDPENPDALAPYEVFETDEGGLITSEIHVNQPYGDHRGVPVKARYTYQAFSPTVAYFTKKTGEWERFCTYLTATPTDEAETVLRMIVAINFGPELTTNKILHRQNIVYEQDRIICESQRPPRLPLDPAEEFHVKSDKLGFNYRRWIRTMGEAKRSQTAAATTAPVEEGELTCA